MNIKGTYQALVLILGTLMPLPALTADYDFGGAKKGKLGTISVKTREQIANTSSEDYIREMLYIRFDLGFAFASNESYTTLDYPDPDVAGAAGIGLYLSLSDSLMLGVSVDTVSEFYDLQDGPFLIEETHTAGQTSLSAMYFPGNRLGEGFFLRADYGDPDLTVTRNNGAVETEFDFDGKMSPALGLGLTVPVSKESRWIFTLMYYSQEFEFDDGSALFDKEGVKFTIGGLW